MTILPIRRAHSFEMDARKAVLEFHAAVSQPDMQLVIFFCSTNYDLDVLAAEMRRLFVGVQVVGCTAAGEIGPSGYLKHSLSGASFPTAICKVVSGRLDELQDFDFYKGHEFTQALMQKLRGKVADAGLKNSFALMLIDGLSIREELVVHAFQHALDNIPLVGGSAADNQEFLCAQVYADGNFHSASAALILINTCLPFRVFQSQDFISDQEQMVVTQADTARRIVREINGRPAAQEYARLAGVSVADLHSYHFASLPVVVMVDGVEYVRGIQKTESDGSLTFLCAIEGGLVLRIAHRVDLVSNLEQTFSAIKAAIGKPQLVLGFDCFQRRMEIEQMGIKDTVGKIFQDNNTIGFNSYGEQIHGMHVNQSLTGIAIGVARTAFENQ
ncbi:FIST N-terminal domain-containing protein [Herbaspirillum sp. RTI4]|uniref:FIST N-terminal domain-containing protein n=1 Tax=Herbaspirillum sp. RTI4 TaxID=3048640 RepID=UPI002AB32B1B|nr:FIST N-terminal domain-containing protein [Herbaspirillum sp. RTI4]MDY7578949.1 FIST N-terminal domain-containing protein [Herbaspirillum sp. RTI4]MEA9980880.1 FIST N-terminal domain-containing protein [Herbaspirillum sp. RTI4]